MKCKKTLQNKKKCNAYAQKDNEFCFRHDPSKKNIAAQASRKGGYNRQLKGVYGKREQLESPEDIKSFLGKVINGVWSESVPVAVGSSMGFLCRCWLDAYEASDITKRLDQIEGRLKQLDH